MARIIVEAVHADGQPRRWTLRERVAAENLANDHYAAQLLERLSWATADAEAVESQDSEAAESPELEAVESRDAEAVQAQTADRRVRA